MPSPTAVIGANAHIYVPDDDDLIDLGYTGIRVYWATSETATASLATTLTLVSGQKDYSYNKTDALATDWFEYAFYGATTGEGPRSERVPVGPPQITREQIRQEVGRRLRIMKACTVLSSPTPTATQFASTNLIDADASSYLYANWVVRFTSGDLDGDIRRVRDQANAGYIPGTGQVKANTFDSAPSGGDTFELWRPVGGEDPSVLIDEAMDWVRHRIWWEDVFYFSIDSDVSEYAVPQVMYEEAVARVDWAADTFPTRPGWQTVGNFNIWTKGGTRWISVAELGPMPQYFGQGDVIRIQYARPGDRMDSDTDYWSVPLEWAVAETAAAYLSRVVVPRGNEEQVQDAERALGALQSDIRQMRELYMPAAYGRVELAR